MKSMFFYSFSKVFAEKKFLQEVNGFNLRQQQLLVIYIYYALHKLTCRQYIINAPRRNEQYFIFL